MAKLSKLAAPPARVPASARSGEARAAAKPAVAERPQPLTAPATDDVKPASTTKPAVATKPAKPPLTPEEEDARKKINRVQIGDMLVEFRGQHKQDQFLYDLLFKDKTDGIFFECGALDGIYLSNTYAFERYFGWRGLLVEPLDRQYEQLKVNRDQSVCLHACVGPRDEHVLFFNHKGGGLSGIVKEVGRRHIERLEFSYMNHPLSYQRNPDLLRLEWKEVVKTGRALQESGFSHIDLFSIDVEGGEYAVLQGIDFDQIEIDVFCIEVNPQSINEVDSLLKGHDYVDIASVGQDVIYLRRPFFDGLRDQGVDLAARMKQSTVRHKPRI